jgi:hypothetical protein
LVILTTFYEFFIQCKNFDAPDAHFAYLSLFSGTQAEKVGNPKKEIVKTVQEPKKPNTVP